MKWRAVVAIGVLFVASACGSVIGQNPATPPDVTVLGTTVGSDQPAPTLGSAVSTARE